MALSSGQHSVMRQSQRNSRVFGFWLGVLALSLNALAPIQLAFGLALAAADAQQCGHRETGNAELHGPGWWAYAVLSAGKSTRDPFQSHKGLHPVSGAVCSLVAAPTGLIVANPAPLPLPALSAEIILLFVAAQISAQATHTAYRSRAPPVDLPTA